MSPVRTLSPKALDTYLGFDIEPIGSLLLAVPRGWSGEALVANSMPAIRRRIWLWWHDPRFLEPSPSPS